MPGSDNPLSATTLSDLVAISFVLDGTTLKGTPFAIAVNEELGARMMRLHKAWTEAARPSSATTPPPPPPPPPQE